SLSLADCSAPVVESKTGVSFPSVLGNSLRLLGIGLRKKSILGLKNIDVYAFGVYANGDDLRKLLSEKYGKLSATELKDNKDFNNDLMEADICMTVRLQIVYSKLSIRSVRSAFEESVGSRLQKFGGSDNKELLQRFTSQFKDEYKIPRGSVIDLIRERSHILKTTIDGKEVGSIQSKLLCRSILDLYIGEDPFDRRAKEDVEVNAASFLQK
ncbi:Chalcone-flavanone isomerase family protein isoform 2, partial [Theobroma cacao]